MPRPCKVVQSLIIITRLMPDEKGKDMAHGRFSLFLLGGAIGASIGLLFAPRSGSETRAFLTDKAEELWGEGEDFYSRSYEKVKVEAANVQSTAAKANDELREKIENARSAIAEQVAKNAQSARETINQQVSVADEQIDQEADVLKGKIDELKQEASEVAEKVAEAAADASEAAGEAVNTGN